MLTTYFKMAQQQQKVSFMGRLGTYRYLDMDVTIAESLAASEQVLTAIREAKIIPSFFVDPR